MNYFKKFNKNLQNKTLVLLCITSLYTLIYYSWDSNSWRFSYVGDEWPFYAFALHILQSHFLLNPFSFDGVFGQNSVISSMYQSIFLLLLGHSNFSWRISNILLIVPLSFFFYRWIKPQFDKLTAIYATILLQVSAYMANFFKTGKNMPQALLLMLVCLDIARRCAVTGSKKLYFLLGTVLGFSFYFYIGPLFPFIIWPYLFIHNKNFQKSQIYALVGGYFLLLMPLVFSGFGLAGPAGKTILGKEYTDNIHLLLNIGNMFLVFFFKTDYYFNQFVYGPYFDTASQILIIVGIIVLLRSLKNKNMLQILLSYLSACIIIGVSVPYFYIPVTRGIFLIPFGALFAGIGLRFFSRYISPAWITCFLMLIAVTNFYQSQIGFFHKTGYTSTALLVKDLQSEKSMPTSNNLYLLLSNTFKYNVQDISYIQQAYGLDSVPLYVYRTDHPSCSNLRDGRVYVFSHDKKSVKNIAALHCDKKERIDIKILKGNLKI